MNYNIKYTLQFAQNVINLAALQAKYSDLRPESMMLIESLSDECDSLIGSFADDSMDALQDSGYCATFKCEHWQEDKGNMIDIPPCYECTGTAKECPGLRGTGFDQ